MKSPEIRVISMKSNDFEISYSIFKVSDPSITRELSVRYLCTLVSGGHTLSLHRCLSVRSYKCCAMSFWSCSQCLDDLKVH